MHAKLYNEISIDSLIKGHNSLLRAMKIEKNEFIRDSAIQRFEYTFELAWKTMKRILKYKGIDAQGTKDIFRICAQEKIIEDPLVWFTFLEARNKTSHTYNEDMADAIYEIIPLFLQEICKFFQFLETISTTDQLSLFKDQ